jgi:L-lactate dehydrogenase complex protein LldG
MSDARETILGRIAEALRLASPRPHLSSDAPAGTPAKVGKPWLPDGGEDEPRRLEILAANLAKLRASLVRAADVPAASAALAGLAADKGWKRLALHRGELTETLARGLGCETWCVEDGFDKRRLEACDAGLTACESLVAQTGSILVSSAANGGRALSILPHAHVVVARKEQVLPDLDAALDEARRRHAGSLPSMLSFITGPSRTGDIERILVLGAHGPKELHVILIG